MTISITVNGAYVVGPVQNLTYTGSAADGPYSHYLYVLGPSGDVTIQGQVLVQDSTGNINLYGAYSDASTGTPTLDVAQGGSFTVTATGVGSGAYGMYAAYAPGSFTNGGTFSVSGADLAIGVQLADGSAISNTGSMSVSSGFGNAQGWFITGAGTINNTGLMAVTASLGSAHGWYINGASTISNSGSLSATGQVAEAIVLYDYVGGMITNSGTITATATSASYAAAAIIVQSQTNGLETIVNTGTISAINTLGGAAVAISELTPTNHFLNLNLTNGATGIINGAITLGNGLGSHIVNQGTINGAVTLGTTGSDVYDGRGGALSGGLTLGGGADTVYLGNDGETVHGGTGTAVVYGGTGNDAITGGTGADFITGGGGNDTLTGGGGADTFAFRVPTGSVTISDFSDAQGDKIDLSAIGNWNLAAVLARAVQSGPNTVITLNGLTITSTT